VAGLTQGWVSESNNRRIFKEVSSGWRPAGSKARCNWHGPLNQKRINCSAGKNWNWTTIPEKTIEDRTNPYPPGEG